MDCVKMNFSLSYKYISICALHREKEREVDYCLSWRDPDLFSWFSGAIPRGCPLYVFGCPPEHDRGLLAMGSYLGKSGLVSSLIICGDTPIYADSSCVYRGGSAWREELLQEGVPESRILVLPHIAGNTRTEACGIVQWAHESGYLTFSVAAHYVHIRRAYLTVIEAALQAHSRSGIFTRVHPACPPTTPWKGVKIWSQSPIPVSWETALRIEDEEKIPEYRERGHVATEDRARLYLRAFFAKTPA